MASDSTAHSGHSGRACDWYYATVLAPEIARLRREYPALFAAAAQRSQATHLGSQQGGTPSNGDLPGSNQEARP